MSNRIEQSTAYEALRAQVSADLAPVRPLATTQWVIGFLILFAPVSGALLWRTFGFRRDYEALGSVWFWGLSVAELVVSGLILTWILREAVPGRRLSSSGMRAAVATGLALHVLISLVTFAKSPLTVPQGMEWMYGRGCFRFEVLLGSLCLLFTLLLSRQGLTTRPRRVGLLGGLGAGLAADAIWRFVCPYSDPAHSFGSHTSGILTVVVAGVVLGFAWEEWRARSWRSRSVS